MGYVYDPQLCCKFDCSLPCVMKKMNIRAFLFFILTSFSVFDLNAQIPWPPAVAQPRLKVDN
jgi:hypothetical protein